MNSKVHIAITSVLAVLFAFVLIDDIRLRAEKQELSVEAEHQKFLKDLQKENFNKELASKSNTLNEFENEAQMLLPYLVSHGDLKRLKENGLANPQEDIKNSLIENQSNLLTDSLLDGRQRIIKDHILLLGGQRVLAYWEAGHSDGVILACYAISAEGEIKWKIIDEMD